MAYYIVEDADGTELAGPFFDEDAAEGHAEAFQAEGIETAQVAFVNA